MLNVYHGGVCRRCLLFVDVSRAVADDGYSEQEQTSYGADADGDEKAYGRLPSLFDGGDDEDVELQQKKQERDYHRDEAHGIRVIVDHQYAW